VRQGCTLTLTSSKIADPRPSSVRDSVEEPGRIALLACRTLFSSLNRGLDHLVEKTKCSPVLIKAQVVLFKENVL